MVASPCEVAQAARDCQLKKIAVARPIVPKDINSAPCHPHQILDGSRGDSCSRITLYGGLNYCIDPYYYKACC